MESINVCADLLRPFFLYHLSIYPVSSAKTLLAALQGRVPFHTATRHQSNHERHCAESQPQQNQLQRGSVRSGREWPATPHGRALSTSSAMRFSGQRCPLRDIVHSAPGGHGPGLRMKHQTNVMGSSIHICLQ